MHSESRLTRCGLGALLVAVLGLAAAGCGSSGSSGTGEKSTDQQAGPQTHAKAVAAADRLGDREWLLRFNISGGGDGERMTPMYVALNPATGATRVTKLPPVTAGDSYGDAMALLVNADHTLAIPDSGLSAAETRSGMLTVYPLGTGPRTVVDIRGWAHDAALQPVGWAFDPKDAATLRVVDKAGKVWKVDLAAKSATAESTLPRKAGWFFSNGFDKNSGQPFIESVDSDQTIPAGNGESDTRALERAGGRLLVNEDGKFDKLPTSTCGFSAAFSDRAGNSWLFCADKPALTSQRLLAGDKAWSAFGKPTAAIIGQGVAEFPLVLPPVS